MTMDHDLMVTPLLTWRDARYRRANATLPGILSGMASGALADFPHARAHQFHPWSMFLTQLAVLALHHADHRDPRLNEGDWRELLLALTGGAHEPWCIVVDDLAKPAFMQPPVPEASIANWQVHEHPDDLDILVTAKNHDVKQSVIDANDIEAWILALATLQTMQGYPGRGYHGISRMKGGYGSRPRVGTSADRTVSSRFLRDVDVMLSMWDSLVDRGFGDNGIGLAWLASWDGADSLPMPVLSPHFIEICWRVRCVRHREGLAAAYTTTQNRRCLPEVENGDTGDAWIPIERDEGALTIGASGFHYALLTRILFEFEPAAAQALKPGDGDPVHLLASAMARGQGKTEGLHERVLLLAGEGRRVLGKTDTRAALGRRASANVRQAATMRSKVLYPALKQIALGDSIVSTDFEGRVNDLFFDHLFSTLAIPDDAAALSWDAVLRDLAVEALQQAISRCCVPSSRWYRAVSGAEGFFYGCLRKHFPTLVATNTANLVQGGTA